jgi:hypothetical protein
LEVSLFYSEHLSEARSACITDLIVAETQDFYAFHVSNVSGAFVSDVIGAEL